MSTRIRSNNFDSTINNIVNDIIPACKNLYFHVGYFYFSGFTLIAKSIEKKNIKILVGMEADKTVTNLSKSIKDKKTDYLRKLSEEVDKKEILDKPEERDAYFIFKKKIQDGSLEVRQSKKPSHPKEFLFEYEKKYAKMFASPGQGLVGSPNLTVPGFITNGELAYLHPEPENFKIAKQDFEDAWEDSTPLLDKENFKVFEKYASKFPFEQKPDPYLMFVRVLDEYFQDRSKDKIKLPAEITEDHYLDLRYQKDAIAKGLDILDKHNGVLIADVVGLGKSIIASAIALNLDLRTHVICPPHLIPQWRNDLGVFGIKGAQVTSSGATSQALEDDIPGQKLIIIDEVHKFRNEATKDYLNLYQLCHDSKGKKPNKVILISATPFNNMASDIFSLIKLFQIPSRSTLQTVTNLSVTIEQINKKFKTIRNNKKKQNKEDIERLGEEIRNIIEPIIIRRSRIDLEKIKAYDDDLKKQNIFFPKVIDPITLQYELGSLENIYEKTLKIISPDKNNSGYKCARYKPLTYVKPEFIEEVLAEGNHNDLEEKKKLPKEQENIHDFIKRMMVRRFESSTKSFSISLDRAIKSNARIIEYYEKKGKIPIYPRQQLPDLEELFEHNTDDNVDLADLDIEENSTLAKYESKGLYWIKEKQLKDTYIIDVKNDLEILTRVQEDWNKILKHKEFYDPKIEAIIKFLKDELKKDPKRKIIIFTEFSDSAYYVHERIKKIFKRAMVYTSNESTAKNKKIIKENFDAGLKIEKQMDDYDILIATDAISEGFNLHRAGTIVNNDIPYNPTRIVQRFGRINRINKRTFNELYIYNFFPTEIGESEVSLKRITGVKRLLMNSILGDDTKILSIDETLTSYFQREFKDIYKKSESASPVVNYENLIYDLRENEPDTVLEANNIARRVKAKRKIKTKEKGLLIFSKKGEIPRFIFSDKDKKIDPMSPIDAFKLFDAKPNEKYINFDKKYDHLYEEIKAQLLKDQKILPPNKKNLKNINKLEKFSRESIHKDYYLKMYKVVKELDGLTKLQLKKVANITEESSYKDIKGIKKIISESILDGLLTTYSEVELKKDTLIITEQIND